MAETPERAAVGGTVVVDAKSTPLSLKFWCGEGQKDELNTRHFTVTREYLIHDDKNKHHLIRVRCGSSSVNYTELDFPAIQHPKTIQHHCNNDVGGETRLDGLAV